MINLKPVSKTPPASKTKQNLRINSTTLALILSIALLVANVVLLVTYFQQHNERDSLASQLDAARESLTRYGSPADIEERQAKAEAALAAQQAYFPNKLSNKDILNGLFRLAEETHVTLAEIRTIPKEDQKLGDHIYSSLSINTQVTGPIANLQDFVRRLEMGALGAASIREIDIIMTEDSPSAVLDFSLYARS